MGGGYTKSAYWVVYISEKEKNKCQQLPLNSYDAYAADLESKHPFGAISDSRIVQKIMDDNRKLVLEVDNFKSSEIAKKVTTLYEKYYDEL